MFANIIRISSLLKINRTIRIMLRTIADLGIVFPFVFLYSKIIKEIAPDDKVDPEKRFTLLAINPTRFLGDLELLAESDKFRILTLSFNWQLRLLAIYWPSKTNWDWDSYFNPDKCNDKNLTALQQALRKFLKKFLKNLYKKLDIDAVIGPSFYYQEDYDIGLISNEIGTPYIVIQRDRISGIPNKERTLYKKISRAYKFRASHLIIQDEEMREYLIKVGYVSRDNISNLGLLGMDKFVKKIKHMKDSDTIYNVNKSKQKVTLFSFPVSVGLKGKLNIHLFPDDPNAGYQRLFAKVHNTIADLALKNENIDFVIKIKWGGIWYESIDKLFRNRGLDIKKISNLKVLDNISAHQLILESDVVCGFSSSALLEAAIAAKPVIVPLFDEALRPEYQESIAYFYYYDLFDCASSVTEFEHLIMERLKNPGPKLSEEFMYKKYEAFERTVSSLDGNALEKYTETICNLINNK
jgi:hypothetical protein